MQPNHLLLAYYADDFTGSTDALEMLTRAGVKTALFIEPPTAEQLERYQGVQAVGVAGRSRSMNLGEMEQELRPALAALRQLGAPHVHYKVCSTFDSSPAIGSIGKAMDIGAAIFQAPFIPLLVAAPALGRYCAFGNLFARMGIGSQGSIYRLDRHPSMCRHPVTPADESDLRLHLARQTEKKTSLFDILQVVLPEAEARHVLKDMLSEGAEVVLFDAIYPEQLAPIGNLIDAYANATAPLFSVGSSGIEMALGAYWTQQGQLQPPTSFPDPGEADRLLVISGSCSPVTAGQIGWSFQKGFAEIALDTAAIAEHGNDLPNLVPYITEAIAQLQAGNSVILHTSRGSEDQRVAQTEKTIAQKQQQETKQRSTADLYGTALGRIAREVLAQVPLQRMVVAGGDTSSFAARAMGIESVEMVAPLSPGAPLCKAVAPGSPVNGVELTFKGGQVGKEDYFGMVRSGKFL